jgi:hypothetical protein
VDLSVGVEVPNDRVKDPDDGVEDLGVGVEGPDDEVKDLDNGVKDLGVGVEGPDDGVKDPNDGGCRANSKELWWICSSVDDG